MGFASIASQVRKRRPLVHNITNYVTVNDCANILIACGASPLMSDEPEEAEQITSICNALNINMGTLNKRTIEAMFKAGKQSNALNHPVIFDPVGVGASDLRNKTASDIISQIKLAAIKGNASEIKRLAVGQGYCSGVDASVFDTITYKGLDNAVEWMKAFSQKTGAVIAMTGAIDIVADETRAMCIFNGHKLMSDISGTGCMLSAMTAACVAANPSTPFEAVCTAVLTMGIAGEMAANYMRSFEGNMQYRAYLIDSIYNMDPNALEQNARYEMR